MAQVLDTPKIAGSQAPIASGNKSFFMFFDTENSNKLSYKDATGVHVIGGGGGGGGVIPFGIAAGPSNAFTVTVSPALTLPLTGGETINVGFAIDCSKDATLDADASGAKQIKKNNGENVDNADILGSSIYTLVYALALDAWVISGDTYDRIPYSEATGTDNYLVDTNNEINAYIEGEAILVRFQNANTGACTVNVNSLGAKDLLKQGGAALVAGSIDANQFQLISYTSAFGGAWILQGQTFSYYKESGANATISAFDVNINGSNDANITAGNTTTIQSTNNATLKSTGGNAELNAAGGGNIVQAGSGGNPVVIQSTANNVTINSVNGEAQLKGWNGLNYVVAGGAGNDTVVNGRNNVQITTDTGDTIMTAQTNAVIIGTTGVATVVGKTTATLKTSAGGGDVEIMTTNVASGVNVQLNASGKLGFYAKAPIVQPNTFGAGAALSAAGVTPAFREDAYDGYTLAQVIKALRDLGLLQ